MTGDDSCVFFVQLGLDIAKNLVRIPIESVVYEDAQLGIAGFDIGHVIANVAQVVGTAHCDDLTLVLVVQLHKILHLTLRAGGHQLGGGKGGPDERFSLVGGCSPLGIPIHFMKPDLYLVAIVLILAGCQ